MFFYLFDVDVKVEGLRRQALAGTANREFDGALYGGGFAGQPDFLLKHYFVLEIADVSAEQFFKPGNRLRLINTSLRPVRCVGEETEGQSHRTVGGIVQGVQVPSVCERGCHQQHGLVGCCFPDTVAPLHGLLCRRWRGCIAEPG